MKDRNNITLTMPPLYKTYCNFCKTEVRDFESHLKNSDTHKLKVQIQQKKDQGLLVKKPCNGGCGKTMTRPHDKTWTCSACKPPPNFTGFCSHHEIRYKDFCSRCWKYGFVTKS